MTRLSIVKKKIEHCSLHIAGAAAFVLLIVLLLAKGYRAKGWLAILLFFAIVWIMSNMFTLVEMQGERNRLKREQEVINACGGPKVCAGFGLALFAAAVYGISRVKR